MLAAAAAMMGTTIGTAISANDLLYNSNPGACNAGEFTFRLDDTTTPQQLEPGSKFVVAISDGKGVFAGVPGIHFYNAAVNGGLGDKAGPN